MDVLHRRLYGRCLRYLGLRMRTEKELREKLERWVADLDYSREGGNETLEVLVPTIVEQLKREGFLNDVHYAREWVISRLKRGKRGPGIIRLELRQKGIQDDVIQHVIHEVESDEVGISEEGGAKHAGIKYLRRLEGKPVNEQRSKLYAHLRGKGFSDGIVRGIIKELVI